jgi:hypothetical protein
MGIAWHGVIERVIGGVHERASRMGLWVLQNWDAWNGPDSRFKCGLLPHSTQGKNQAIVDIIQI